MFSFTDSPSKVFNPFTAPACNISGLKDARAVPANSIFSGPIPHLLSMQCILMKILSDANEKKKTKRLKGFRFDTFIGPFWMTSWL